MRGLGLFRSLFAAIAFAGAFLANPAAEDLTFCQQGIGAREAGDHDLAISRYTHCLDYGDLTRGNRAVIFYNRGNAYKAKGAYDHAIADFDEAIRLDPGLAKAFNNRGRARFYLGRYSDAVPDRAKAAELAPDDVYSGLWHYLARARAGQGRRSALAPHAGKGAWPGPVAAMLLGNTSADALLAAARDPDPKTRNEQLCEAHFYIGQKLLLEGRKRTAADHFRAAVNTGVTNFIEYAGAKAELKRMEY